MRPLFVVLAVGQGLLTTNQSVVMSAFEHHADVEAILINHFQTVYKGGQILHRPNRVL